MTQFVDWSSEKTANRSIGLNVEWTGSDRLTLEFDYHNSTAVNSGGANDMGFANGSWSGYGDGQSFDNGNPYNQWAELTNLRFIANNTIPDWIPTTSVGFQWYPRTERDLEGVDMSSTTAHLRYNNKGKKSLNEFFFTYNSAGLITFLLCFLLSNVKLDLGFALGLFAIFAILRFRTETIKVKEMTYFFVVIGVSAINALSNNNASILVFDEATSALDGLTEKKVMDAIYNLSGSKTIITIAHRLATIKKCDLIYLLDDGKIIDSGKYDDLKKRNTLFESMTNFA